MKLCTLHIQETIDKKLYTIYKTSKPYLKSSLHSYYRKTEIYNGFWSFLRQKRQVKLTQMFQREKKNDLSNSKGST